MVEFDKVKTGDTVFRIKHITVCHVLFRYEVEECKVGEAYLLPYGIGNNRVRDVYRRYRGENYLLDVKISESSDKDNSNYFYTRKEALEHLISEQESLKAVCDSHISYLTEQLSAL